MQYETKCAVDYNLVKTATGARAPRVKPDPKPINFSPPHFSSIFLACFLQKPKTVLCFHSIQLPKTYKNSCVLNMILTRSTFHLRRTLFHQHSSAVFSKTVLSFYSAQYKYRKNTKTHAKIKHVHILKIFRMFCLLSIWKRFCLKKMVRDPVASKVVPFSDQSYINVAIKGQSKLPRRQFLRFSYQLSGCGSRF